MRAFTFLLALAATTAALPLSSLADSVVYDHITGESYYYDAFHTLIATADDVNLAMSSGRLTQIDVNYYVSGSYVYSGGKLNLSVYEQTGSPWTIGTLLGSTSVNIAAHPFVGDSDFRVDSVPVNIAFSTPNLIIEVGFTDSNGNAVIGTNIALLTSTNAASVGSSDVNRMALLQSLPDGWSYVDEHKSNRADLDPENNGDFRVYATNDPLPSVVPLPTSVCTGSMLLAGLAMKKLKRRAVTDEMH